ncbi:RidA family protein [Sphingomonas flavalba]|uniref:RidA family protein n=1 Tax=Sphingomonas flavalba TaxID=2559804 RepID=UPI0039DF5BBD
MEGRQAQRIKTSPDPFEPFCLSQGFRIGDLIILSGQAAMTEEGAVVGIGDFDAQAEQVFRNIARLLAAAGASLADIVKVTIFLTDMQYFPKVVELRRKWFTAPYPADSIVEVRALALPELMIEIEATAIAGVRKQN